MTVTDRSIHCSKRDTWIVAVLWISVAVVVWMIVRLWLGRGPDAVTLILTPLFGLTCWLALSVLYGTRYELGDRILTIRSGPLRWRVPYDAIDEISPTRSSLSGPACSLDRLQIRYGESRAGLLISPTDKAEFLRDLLSRAPGLSAEGDRVVRDQARSGA
jgi:hypothetical protein